METITAEKEPRPDAFVGMLIQLEKNQDREALAHLRGYVRGTTGDALRASKYVAPYLGEKNFPSDRWFYTVGGLFAYHPAHTDQHTSLGAAFRRLRETSGSMDQRFLALVGTDSEALDKPLFQAVSLLRAHGVSLNYFRLLQDLLRWGHDENYVQKNWARDYFRSEKGTDKTTNESETSSDEN
jgi:CRISPR system Cascade subunit CasB